MPDKSDTKNKLNSVLYDEVISKVSFLLAAPS